MMTPPRLITSLLLALVASTSVACSTTPTTPQPAPAPLFVDPNYHGSCDPEVVWNPADEKWYLYYTGRRSTRTNATYVGTPIGVVSSPDLVTWSFEGYCDFTDSAEVKHEGQPDMNVTFWAPGITRQGDTLHMFVTYKNNANPPWGGKGEIRHYTAPIDDPINGWTLADPPDFTQPDPIDATIVFDEATGKHRAYYRVANNGGVQWAESDDMLSWTNRGKAGGDVNTLGRERFGYQEAPYVFRLDGAWWMLTDPHKGLVAYRSDDGVDWTFNNVILAEGSDRPMDATRARHPSVAEHGDRALIFYHCEPNRIYGRGWLGPEERTVEQKKSVLQIAELRIEDGKLVADRDVMLP